MSGYKSCEVWQGVHVTISVWTCLVYCLIYVLVSSKQIISTLTPVSWRSLFGKIILCICFIYEGYWSSYRETRFVERMKYWENEVYAPRSSSVV